MIPFTCGIKKNSTNEHICKIGKVPDVENKRLVTERKSRRGQIDSLGLIHTTMYETENQSDPAVQHRELYSVLCSDLYRKRALKRVHICVQVSSVQSLSRVRLFVTLWTAAHQDSPSITNSWSLLKLMSIKSVMPPNHLILCRPLLLPPSIFPSIRVISNDSVLHIRWPQY